MARKSKEAREELASTLARLEEVKKIQELAEQEEIEILEKMQGKIDSICNANNLFCGYVLDTNGCVSLLKTAIENGGNVRIPYKLYFIE